VLAAVGTGLPLSGCAATPAGGRATHEVDVRDFGAKGDGVTDDAPAINAAIRALRASQSRVGDFGFSPRLVLSTGAFAVGQSLDLTRLRNINLVIDGRGSVILGQCAGQPVIDALGSRWLTVRDLTVIGDKRATPSLGLQIGRLGDGAVADDHRFENVKFLGRYALACLLNAAAETTAFDHVLMWNDSPSAESFCLIQDGLNHFGAVSAFAGPHSKRDQNDSFNENLFVNCDFRHSGAGAAVWLGDTARHAFIRCYAAGNGAAAFVVHSGDNGHVMLDVDCHCETSRLQSAFLFTGPSTRPRVRGFSYKDQQTFAAQSVFRCGAGVQKVTLQHARIEIAGYFNSACRVFDDPSRWAVIGEAYSGDAAAWNGAGCFTGSLQLADGFEFVRAGASPSGA